MRERESARDKERCNERERVTERERVCVFVCVKEIEREGVKDRERKK